MPGLTAQHLRRAILRRSAQAALGLPLTRNRVSGILDSAQSYVTDELGEPSRFVPIGDGARFEGRPGRTVGREDELLAKSWNHEDWPVWRVSLAGGRVVGADPLVLTDDRRALRESALDESHLLAHPQFEARLPLARRVRGRLLLLTGPWWNNWYHWLLDLLPRAALLPLDEDPQAEVLVPAHLTPAQEECLALIGVTPERWRRHLGGHVVADELVFPSRVAPTGNPPRWALRWLHERLAPAPAQHDRRLYVSRADASQRRVVNEHELTAMLLERGFETVVPSELSLREQLTGYAESEVVVGPHGAGLANVFAGTTAKLIELHREDMVRRCFFAQANAQRLDYWYLLCRPAGSVDLVVDLDQLERTLDAAGIG